MEEQSVFDRFHEALELEPNAGAYERFRSAFTNPTAAARSRPLFRLRFSNMGFRVAATLAVGVILIALLAAYVATHHGPTSFVPAGSNNVKAYQTMMRTDDDIMAAGTVNNCGTVHDAVCMPAIQRTIPNLQKWIADIDAFHTPPQFAVINAQMRLHLTAAIAELNVTARAIQAGNQSLFNVSLTLAGTMQRIWIDTVVGAITDPRSTTVAAYASFLDSEKQNLSGCTGCQDLGTTATVPACLRTATLSDVCMNEVVEADNVIGVIEAATVSNVPPSSIAKKNSQLQSDLAAADTALIKMGDAFMAGDVVAFNSDRADFENALAIITPDITAITA